MESLKGKVAVVTGASEGLGEAIVRQLAAEGMKVAALARREDMLKNLEDELTAKGYSVKTYVCDVQIEESVKAAFKAIDEDFGGISVMINNAAVYKEATLTDINLDIATTIFNTNIIGVLSCTREAFSSMNKHSIQDGHIIFINSITGHRSLMIPEISTYSATKKAITSLSNNLREELALKKSKIRVTSISPTLIKTTMAKNLIPALPHIPYLYTEDVVSAVIFAISAPSHVNISEIIIDAV